MVYNCVLNLIINGLPSILNVISLKADVIAVLNLIINGLPSILNPGFVSAIPNKF